jgi:hypothetical protein
MFAQDIVLGVDEDDGGVGLCHAQSGLLVVTSLGFLGHFAVS